MWCDFDNYDGYNNDKNDYWDAVNINDDDDHDDDNNIIMMMLMMYRIMMTYIPRIRADESFIRFC